MYVSTQPSITSRMRHKDFLKWNIAGSNSEYSFFKTNCLNKFKERGVFLYLGDIIIDAFDL